MPATTSTGPTHAPAPSAASYSAGRDGLVLVVGVVVILALTVGAGLLALRSRADAIEDWRVYLENLSAIIAQHALQSLTASDLALNRIIDGVRESGVSSESGLRRVAATRETFEMMRERVRGVPQIEVASIIAVNGDIINFTRQYPVLPINLADRDYLREHAANPELDLFLSRPVRNRVNGEWTIFLVRKIRLASRQTVGYALIGIRCDFFEDLYQSVNLSDRYTAISLFRRDGVLLARYPRSDNFIGESFAHSQAFRLLASGAQAGTAVSNSPRITDPSDTSLRIVAPRTVPNYPAVVVARATEGLILQHWRLTESFVAAGVALLDGVIAGLTIWIYRLLRRRRETFVQLEGMRRAAEQASSAKSQFLANMSHEVRTPLHGMLGVAELLLSSELDAEQRGHMLALQRAGHTLLHTINDLLDFAKIEAGRLELERLPYDLHRALHENVELFAPRAEAKGLALTLAIGEEVPRMVVGDALRLDGILGNLISNAIKFTETGSISVAARGEGGERVRFSVRDTGIGLSPQTKARIFDPFMQADNSTTRRFGGTGLGLSIVKRLVDLHGGACGVDSVEGRGAEFWFVLPMTRMPKGMLQQAGEAGAAPSAANERLHGEVLLAEDNPLNLELATAMLRSLGLTVRTAVNGLDAVAEYRKKPATVVLMDVQMPGLDGLEATLQIRALEAELGRARAPVIALTANARVEDRDQCLAAGMDDFVAKPFSRGEVAAALRRWLGAPAGAQRDRFADLPVFDATSLDELVALRRAGEPDVRIRLFSLYRESLGKSLASLDDALGRGDCGEAGRISHGIKSATLNVGGKRLSARFAFVEQEARSGRLATAVDVLPAIRDDARQLLAALDEQLARLARPAAEDGAR
jgi:signal transduction histidine kinase/CheY-like chemotaxis protein/HPt (histidine-containing phosphotransfer) domain-containing protein